MYRIYSNNNTCIGYTAACMLMRRVYRCLYAHHKVELLCMVMRREYRGEGDGAHSGRVSRQRAQHQIRQMRFRA